MEIEGIYLHGGAKGFSFINDRGTQAEYDSFFKRFYDKITKAAVSIQKIESINKSFIIESLPINGKQFYDYTFMEHFVYDVNGRPSYFGITIRLSAFYCEIPDLFFILDTIFKRDVIGNLLLPKESTFIFVKDQIDKLLFEKIMKDFILLSSNVLQEANLKAISSVSVEKDISLNLIDCQLQVVEKAIAQYSRLIITTDAPLQREFKSQQEIDKLNQQWTGRLNDLQSKQTAAINNAQKLNGTIQSLRGQLSQAQNDLQRVQKEFSEYKSKNKLSFEVINGLQEEKKALMKLVGFVDSLGIEERQGAFGNQNNRNRLEKDNNKLEFNLKPYFSYIIPGAVIVLIISFLLSLKDCYRKGFISFEKDDKTPVAEVVTSSVDTTALDIGKTSDAGSQPISDLAVSEEAASEYADEIQNVDFKTLVIDVAEFTKDVKHMVKNQVYTIRICGNTDFKPVNGVKGEWKIQDSDFLIGNPTSAVTSITPKKIGRYNIQFFVDGCETPLIRSIEVK